ncbi:CaiB/BaiF CoA transferase family protein [Rhodospirillum rubrum]|uniref:L-carnitine dehydratase/bile acid-inducible protein F n=2 Tax=Rhodospirillum rubrum TaxID=1085 RepID=Q2RST9_RHORT|nr:CaiB/BaiF CoA-transferase family protein [Rhodospirillum rubrum]ABC22806.1 L-carnitine dehydratase/bile acid-inducible protein F [Rhodospirillum rubrum ATCC 11170]AEO48528.1 L-carnitine dehydratase/bile acid-inducible protein F [Rhodospirillum rubrum F11]MBK5954404.1 CoA transferase [Rhodospirillum rubrum]QXG78796.1 CoA transferase [Rhodospirillum rubrum]HAP98706.1 CoA transferase [Rhodospirillum rubrum]
MAAALDGIRVLDLSRVLAGPWASQALADLGAEVIKIERPGAGDDTRSWGPPFLKDEDGRETTDAAYFLAANRGKKSLTVDITKAEGQDLVRALAARSHVVIENFKLGGLAKYGLDWPSLRAVNPALVYCSITGFGQTGPYAPRAGYDAMIQAMSGLMSVTGEPDGVAGGGPMKVGVAVTDILTGLYAAFGILAALRHAEATGEGQHIDLALMDTAVACMANQAANALVGERVPGRLGTAHPNIVPYQAFATQDGHLMLAVGNDGQFARLCAIGQRPDLPLDPRFARNRDRVAHRAALLAEIIPMMASRSTDAWIAALESAGVPCGPINTLDRVFADPQVIARGLRVDGTHAEAGTVPMVRNPLLLSATPPTHTAGPPTLGQHTDGVLSDVLGLTAEDITTLRQKAIV